MKYGGVAIMIILLIADASCMRPVICTEEFRIIGLEVNGGSLTDYFTIRLATGDTISHDDYYNPGANWYPVLTDNYHPNMRRKNEDYRFIGLIDGSVVVDEAYVITADKCHIRLVNGKKQVSL